MMNSINKRAGFFPGWVMSALLLLYPLVCLSMHNAGNAILYITLIVSLLALVLCPRADGIRATELARRFWPLYLAMLSTVLAVFAHQLWNGHFGFKFYDRPLRLAIFPLVLWAVMFVPARILRLLPWSLLAATLILTVKAFMVTAGGVERFGNIGFISIIAYSDMALMFGALCLGALAGRERPSKWVLAAFLLAFVAGAYTGVLNQTRSGWLAVLLFALFFLLVSAWSWRRKVLCVLALVLATSAILGLNAPARERLFNTGGEVSDFTRGEGRDTSVGIRLQLWGAAVELYQRAPVFGIGRENYEPAIREMVERGELTEELATLAHSHNEILFSMATTGTLGLLALLAVYLAPLWYFTRHLRHPSPQARAAAHCGCILVIGFFAFGLTDLMFFWPVLDGLYSIFLAVYVSLIVKAQRGV